MTTGRNFDEILRVLDSMQMTAKYNEAKTLFPGGWKAVKPYLRVTKQPGS